MESISEDGRAIRPRCQVRINTLFVMCSNSALQASKHSIIFLFSLIPRSSHASTSVSPASNRQTLCAVRTSSVPPGSRFVVISSRPRNVANIRPNRSTKGVGSLSTMPTSPRLSCEGAQRSHSWVERSWSKYSLILPSLPELLYCRV